MDRREDWPEEERPADAPPLADGSWSVPATPGPTPPTGSLLRRRLPLALAALCLVGAGSGLTLLLTSGTSSVPSSTAGLDAVSPGRGALSPSLTRRIARRLDRAVVDVNSVIETPSGPADVAGTGMVLTPGGIVVTNNHVVEEAKTIKVTVNPGHLQYAAQFVGADPSADVAVLRIVGAGPLSTVALGSSARVEVGEGVLAFGNSLGLGGTASVTSGTVSALGRSITATSETGADAEHLSGMIETDAPIAPGNSGGPLVNDRGRVVGMNTAAASVGGSGSAVAFAIPIDRVEAIVRAIERGTREPGLVLGRSAYLGIEGTTVKLVGPPPRGAVNVVQVEPGTPAESAGLEAGDVITAFDGIQVHSMPQLSSLISALRPGAEVTLGFEAGGTARHVVVELVAGPAA